MNKADYIQFGTVVGLFVAIFVLVAMLSGCTLISEADPALKAQAIKVIARTATFEGLKQGFDDDEADKRRSAAALIHMGVTRLFSIMEDDDDLTVGDFREIVGVWSFDGLDIPPEVKFALSDAMDLALLYVRPVALDELLTANEILYLNAFLEGIREGASSFIGAVGD